MFAQDFESAHTVVVLVDTNAWIAIWIVQDQRVHESFHDTPIDVSLTLLVLGVLDTQRVECVVDIDNWHEDDFTRFASVCEVNPILGMLFSRVRLKFVLLAAANVTSHCKAPNRSRGKPGWPVYHTQYPVCPTNP